METYNIVFHRGSQSIKKNDRSRFTKVPKWIRDNNGSNLKSTIRKLEYLIKVSTPFQRHKQNGWEDNLPAMKHNFKLVNRGIEYFNKSYQTLCLGTVLTEQRGLYFSYPVRSITTDTESMTWHSMGSLVARNNWLGTDDKIRVTSSNCLWVALNVFICLLRSIGRDGGLHVTAHREIVYTAFLGGCLHNASVWSVP